MHKNTEDRRAKRSRRMLKESLLALMQEKKFQEISARDVTERADLNRGTFYLHYPDTQALLESIIVDIISEGTEVAKPHLAEMESSQSIEPVVLPLLDYILEKKNTIELLMACNAGCFLDKLHELFYSTAKSYASARYGITDPVQMDYFINFAVLGFLSMIKVWLRRGADLPKQKLVAYADAMLQKAAEAAF